MQLIIFEDGRQDCFGPLTVLRPAFDLRCGALLLREKLELRRPGSRCALVPRAELADLVAETYPDRGVEGLTDEPALVLSARVIVDDALLDALSEPSEETLLASGGTPVGAVLQGGARQRVRALAESGGDLSALGVERTVEVPARVATYPWELVNLTAEEIEADARVLGTVGQSGATVHERAHLENPSRIALGPGTVVGPGAVLDAGRGAILVGRDVTIMPNAYVQGPAVLGERSVVRAGASIYGGVSLGPACKVGGEITESVLHSYSNKQHGGFLGHSYLGSWVNLGAGTDNSDLKNNYGSVRVELGGEVVETGSVFVGAVVGDHSKTAIGTVLNTGTVVGVFVNVLARGFPPKTIRSFSWGTDAGFVEYDIERAIETARRVTARREAELTPAMEALIRRAHAERG
jgi:UDP-N-acetylglucosamine diphosphorylase/glucosamine-1-phosphate N-acetyltransferase